MALNKKLLASGFAALALLGTTVAASAAPAFASANVNVRSGPGTGYSVVDSLRRGQPVDIDYCRGSWCFITKPGPDGWVSANYLERGRDRGPRWDDRGWDRPRGWNPPPPPPPRWDPPRPPRHYDDYRPYRVYPVEPEASFCFNGPNGYFCAGN